MKPVKMLIAAAATAVLAGCAQNCATINSNSNSGAIVGTSSLNRNIGVSTSSSSLAGDMIVGKVSLQNRTSDQQQVKYQFQWMDSTGSPIGAATPWQPLTLEPQIGRVVSSVAPSPEATNFNVLVCQ